MPTDVIITAPVQKSRFTLATFYDRIRGNCGLRGSNRVTDVDILEWCNEAQDEMALETHWYRTSSSISLVAGTKEYNIPTDCLGIEEVWFNPTEARLIPMTRQDISNLSFYSPTWRYSSQGTPVYYYFNVNSAIGLHPTPDTTTSNALFLTYSALPPRATLSSDYMYHPPGHEKTVIYFACWKASLKDAIGEGEKRMNVFRLAYVEAMNKLKKQVEGMFEENITVVGEYGSTTGGRWFPRPDWADGSPILPI